MKTHDLARSLRQLAKILRAGPNIEFSSFASRLQGLQVPDSQKQIAVNLATLSAMSRINKKKWLEFIEANRIHIEVRPRDASRDILGKLLRYLEEHEDVFNALRKRAQEDPRSTSPELTKALSMLLK